MKQNALLIGLSLSLTAGLVAVATAAPTPRFGIQAPVFTGPPPSVPARAPKYVMFFLGDGMSSTQIQAAEAYLTTINGGNARNAEDLLKPENRLSMTKLPSAGMQTTYDAYALMTDSASSATAFAAGVKTRSGTIGMDATLTHSVKSVAELAHAQGRRVGVITSVSLNHATPAAYYAKVTSRGLMNNIATQMANSGYEFFGGGGITNATTRANGSDTANNIWDLLTANGYAVLTDRPSMQALLLPTADRGEKYVAINPVLTSGDAMPYAIDRPAENLSLAEMTEVAIAHLYAEGTDPQGFFLAVEGGKIDWAGHANDAVANIGDMLDFDQAVAKALAFYAQHPNDTLIIVTGDHETGGMSIGHATTGYTAYYDRLLGQDNSFEYIQANQWAQHKAAYSNDHVWTNPANLAGNAAMLALIQGAFGLDWAQLNAFQQQKLEDAYDMSMVGQNANSSAENTFLYGGYEPIIVTLTHILNERASIGWTSYAHTGVPVPVYAQGSGADKFQGFYDNTDIAKRIALLMGLPTLPVYEAD